MAQSETKLKKVNLDSNQQAPLYEVDEVRKQAQDSILCGAVTADYPLDLEYVQKILNEALASEILCVLRYRHHQIIADGIYFPEIAEEFKEHAENEEKHMLQIAERIDQLGGNPDFNPATIVSRTATEYGNPGRNDIRTLIKDDLVAERVVIEVYRKMIDFFGTADPTSRRMIEKILADEEEHANDLASLLSSDRIQQKEREKAS